MNYMYDTRRRAEPGPAAEHPNSSFDSGPSLDALRAGMAKPSAEQMGSRVDLPGAIQAKFERSFGADLSALKLYRSQAVADAGANAVAQGNSIAFAPGRLDFTSAGGQALLGHEISHVVSQARGEVRGSGFLNDPALEARADREGAMAAAGRQIYASAMPIAALSSASAASAAGPMQAMKDSTREGYIEEMTGKTVDEEYKEKLRGLSDKDLKKEYKAFAKQRDRKEKIDYLAGPAGSDERRMYLYSLSDEELNAQHKAFKNVKPGLTTDVSKIRRNRAPVLFDPESVTAPYRKEFRGFEEQLQERYGGMQFSNNVIRLAEGDETKDRSYSGVNLGRVLHSLMTDRGRGFNMSPERVTALMDNLVAPQLNKNGSKQEKLLANKRFDKGMKQLKQIYYDDLKYGEKKYGKLLTQMHPEDVLPQTDDNLLKFVQSSLDLQNFAKSGKEYFDKDSEEDRDFLRLDDYYASALGQVSNYQSLKPLNHKRTLRDTMKTLQPSQELENSINGPELSPEQQQNYIDSFQERKEDDWVSYGRFRI